MAGMIQNQVDPTKIAGYDPEKITMTPDQTVESRVQGIIQKNSPLQQMAETRAKQEQNAKGTLNSSMAIQAGQNAVIQNALPIASQDANTATTVALSNQNAGNTAGQFNAGQVNQSGIIGQQIQGQKELSAQDYMQQKGINQQQIQATLDRDILAQKNALELATKQGDIQSAQIAQQQLNTLEQMQTNFGYQTQFNAQNFQNDLEKMNLDQANKVELTNLTNQFQTTLQNSTNASAMHQQAMVNITNIQNNPDTTTEQKKAATQQQYDMLKGSLQFMQDMEGGDYDFSIFPDITGASGNPSSDNSSTSGSNTTGGMAPGQPTLTAPIGTGQINLSPGQFVGETKEVRVGGTGPRAQITTKRIQWTQQGWVVIG